jgi:hypothetical protein
MNVDYGQVIRRVTLLGFLFLLSTKILSDFQAENKDLNKMPFRMIKTILKTRYEIETPSAGLFFENQPKEYQTTVGHKSKFAFIKK